MRKKVLISLLAIFLLFSCGALIATYFITESTDKLRDVIKLHEVEQLRRTLVIDVRTVQSDFYAAHTELKKERGQVTIDITKLITSSIKCSVCHHAPEVASSIRKIQSLVRQYGDSVKEYIVMPENAPGLVERRLAMLQNESELIELVSEMSHKASNHLATLTNLTMEKIDDVRIILFLTLLITLLLSIRIAKNLTWAVTEPVQKLVDATRMISSGKLGSTITYDDDTEFGELSEHFNQMSIAVKEGYTKLEDEMRERRYVEKALIESERFLNTVFDSILDPFCIINSQYEIVRVNKSYAALKNLIPEELIGSTCCDLPTDENELCDDCIVFKTFKTGQPYSNDKLLENDETQSVWLEMYTYPIFDSDGKVSHVIEYTRDITARKTIEDALRESEERYALAAQGANDGLWDWDLQRGTVYFSPRWKAMLGYDAMEITNSPSEWLNRIHPDDKDEVDAGLKSHIDGHTLQFESELRMLNKEGEYRWMLCRGIAVQGLQRMAGSMTDITERKTAEEQLVFDALHDSLTGLANRVLFMESLRHALNYEKRNHDYMFAVLFIDIDRFKLLNDSLGHMIGDRVLIAISGRLEESLRPGDTVARLGGDEFAVLLEDVDGEDEVLTITERIQDGLAKPFNISGHQIYASASIGIAYSSIDYEKPEYILRDADIAMYQAKNKGRDRFEIFDMKMYATAMARLQLETDLRRAVENEEFELFYQPIISVASGNVASFEALIRWRHPVRGLVYSNEFIAIAEETGIITIIGEWVIREACLQLKKWQKSYRRPDLSVSVNVSSKQLVPKILNRIENVLAEAALKPECLILEITESMIMENTAVISPLLISLKAMGIKVYIDDFGTGYSSLSYLHQFSVNALKIDRSFIMRLGHNEEKLEIVRAITTMANNLKINVVAEGVANEDQLELLRGLKCDYVQGYLFSKPLSTREVKGFLMDEGVGGRG
ncbi:EAL domain-containing protein [bacterium]|nr:EAL domain-containing protein [bacterium]